MKHLVLALALLFALAMPAAADDWDDAVAALGRGDYATAYRLSKPLADRGNPEAQHFLGRMYVTGRGIPQNYSEAVRWYGLAAEQGHAEAQVELGLMYDNGEGVPQNYAEAMKWYRLAAEQGHAVAQHNLGVMYAKGQGVPQDNVQAHKWANLAAAKQTDPENLRSSRELRDSVASMMTPAQIAEAQKLAAEWIPQPNWPQRAK